MVNAIIIFLYSITLIVMSLLYLRSRYSSSENESVLMFLKRNRAYLFFTAIVFTIMLIIEVIYIIKHNRYSLPVVMKWSTLFWGIFLLARIDYQEKKIPNKIIIILFAMRIVFLLYEICIGKEVLRGVIGYPVLGAIIAGVIMIVAMILSRNSVGMGDVKMFIIIGFFVGSTEILATMFYAFLVSAIGGVILLVTRKAGLKDTVPMAPFASIGIAIEYLMLMIGGC